MTVRTTVVDPSHPLPWLGIGGTDRRKSNTQRLRQQREAQRRPRQWHRQVRSHVPPSHRRRHHPVPVRLAAGAMVAAAGGVTRRGPRRRRAGAARGMARARSLRAPQPRNHPHPPPSRILRSDFRVSGFRFQVSAYGIRVSGFGLWISGFRF